MKPFARSAIEEPFQAPEFVNRSIGRSLRDSKMAAYQKALLQVRTAPFHEFQVKDLSISCKNLFLILVFVGAPQCGL